MNFKHIYKIIDNSEWQKAKEKGSYKGSRKDLDDGYIHFSEQEQVNGVLNKFFKSQKNLVLLKVDTNNLQDLLWEQASDGNMFPHLYSSLDTSNVVNEFEIILTDDDNHKLPVNF
jgi:uncharacterized protein (DUF952 family)|tara:strand:- start:813 stop:1157 length:345 start_codon:yes stop_codon:yes gene_type:complete